MVFQKIIQYTGKGVSLHSQVDSFGEDYNFCFSLVAGQRSDEALLLLGDRLSLRHPDLLQRPAGVHRAPDDAHLEVLLLDSRPQGPDRDHSQGSDHPRGGRQPASLQRRDRLHTVLHASFRQAGGRNITQR